MTLFFHKDFKRKYWKLPSKIRLACDERLSLFGVQPFDRILENHPLRGEFAGYRSVNVTGDFRAIYKEIAKDAVEFVKIGSHHELFGH